jgi:hypothetical protein
VLTLGGYPRENRGGGFFGVSVYSYPVPLFFCLFVSVAGSSGGRWRGGVGLCPLVVIVA